FINVSFTLDSNDVRPAFICEDGKDIQISKCKIPATTGAGSIIRLENVTGALITNNEVKGKTNVFVKIEGETSTGIKLLKNKLPGKTKKAEASDNVKAGAAVYTIK